MNKNLSVLHSIEINADTKIIWDTLTNPDRIKEYLYDTETVTDWKVNSPIYFQGEYQGQQYKDKGTILDFQPEKLLQYNYWSGFSGMEDTPDNYSVVTYKIDKHGETASLSVSQKGFSNEQSQKHSETGWLEVLKKIKLMCEN